MHNKIIDNDQILEIRKMLENCVDLAIYEMDLEIGTPKTQVMLASYGSVRTGATVYVENDKLMGRLSKEQLDLFRIFFEKIKFEIVEKNGLPKVSVSFTFNTD